MNDVAIASVPIREGLFRDTPDGPVLLGQRGLTTGHIQFPPGPLSLAEPDESLEEVQLSREGELFCETAVHMKTPHFDPPYHVGYIALPEGLKVFAPLRPVEGKPFRVGMRMRLELASLWQEEGKDIVAYRFYPV